MDNLYYEELVDRRLWIDGESSYSSENLLSTVLSDECIEGIAYHNKDRHIEKLLKFTDINMKPKTLPDFSLIDESFTIPKEYFEVNLENYFLNKAKQKIKQHNNSTEEYKKAVIERVFLELDCYTEKNMLDILYLSMFIVDTLKKNEIVWGPGRGSACCSYLLYLLELHDIDSVEFELDIFEFLRDH